MEVVFLFVILHLGAHPLSGIRYRVSTVVVDFWLLKRNDGSRRRAGHRSTRGRARQDQTATPRDAIGLRVDKNKRGDIELCRPVGALLAPLRRVNTDNREARAAIQLSFRGMQRSVKKRLLASKGRERQLVGLERYSIYL